jgi:hypothetical protein
MRLLPGVFLLLAACAPSPEVVQTAIAQTQQAASGNSSSILGGTPAAEVTPGTGAPSNSGLGLVKPDFPLLLMDVTDLPAEGKYVVPNAGSTGEVDNQAVLDAWGAQEGGSYIAETGRVDGWWIGFRRTGNAAALPSEVFDSIVLYQSPIGARLSVQKYADHGMQDYAEVKDTSQVGDGARGFILEQGGSVDYFLYFWFRNCQHVVEVKGGESETTPALATSVAQTLVQKMETTPGQSCGG